MHKSVALNKKSGAQPRPIFASNRFENEFEEIKSISSNQDRKRSMPKQKVDVTYSQDKYQYNLPTLKSKFKSSVIVYLQKIGKNNSFSQDTVSYLNSIDQAENIDSLVDSLFKIFNSLSSENLSKAKSSKARSSHSRQVTPKQSILLNLRTKETKIIRLMKDQSADHPHRDRGKSSKKIHQLELYTDSLKKQLFTAKEEKQQMQKKMLELIEEYKNRKSFYMAQIKKLTDIINMSSFDVRNLVLEKTKEARDLQSKIEQDKSHQVSALQINIQQTNHKSSTQKDNFFKYQNQGSRRDNDFLKPIKGYNTQIRMTKGINSTEHFDDFKNDNNMLY